MDLSENILKLILESPNQYKKSLDGYCLLCPEKKKGKAYFGNYPLIPILCANHNSSFHLSNVMEGKCFHLDDNINGGMHQCTETAIYGFYHKEALYCKKHKLEKTIDVISRFEEKDLFKFILSLSFLADRQIHNNLSLSKILEKKIDSRYRPDILIKSSINIIIVEVDENQHKNYKLEKEIERERKIKDIIKIHLNLPLIFIRINVDVFYDCQSKIILFPRSSRFKLLEKVLLEHKDFDKDKKISICFDRSEKFNYIQQEE